MRVRKVICAALCALLVCAAARADAPKLSDDLFSRAKQAVGYLSSGEYERLVTLLPFSDVAPSAAEWQSFADNFSNLSHAQSEYAVAYWTGSVWKLAVPAQAPDRGDVETLVLSSEDGKTFSGYHYTRWSKVEREYSGCDRVQWNREYIDGTPTLLSD